MNHKNLSIYFLLAAFLLILYLFFKMIWPFFSAILIAVIIVYLFYPVFTFLKDRFKYAGLASFLTCSLIVLIVVIPIIILMGIIVNQTTGAYNVISEQVSSGTFIETLECEGDSFSCTMRQKFIGFITEANLQEYAAVAMEKTSQFIVKHGQNFLAGVVGFLGSLFIMLLSMFYFFKDGKKILDTIKNVIPLKFEYQDRILKQFGGIIKGALIGSVVTSMVQGALGGLGFWILNMFFGANILSPILLGSIMALFALVPFVGSAIIWLPVAVMQLVTGNYVAGIVLIAYGVLVIGSIDNFIKPKIIGQSANIHPLLIFLTVFGGLQVFGFIGLILGPVIASVLTIFVSIYNHEFKRS